ncbi:MAG: hypothetical protein KKH17_03040, partial [Proteobacteria bacterium]|nr:hypothetical protein [Pseudomonadota bacterium]
PATQKVVQVPHQVKGVRADGNTDKHDGHNSGDVEAAQDLGHNGHQRHQNQEHDQERKTCHFAIPFFLPRRTVELCRPAFWDGTTSKGEAVMKITYIAEKINLNQVMDISVDVHKDNLNFFFCC